MSKRKQYKLAIDEEFRRIVPPMPQDRLDMLRRQIRYFGCDHPIITWHRIIVYSYEEYAFCEEFQLPFTIKELEYNFRSEVINYVSKKCLYLDYLTDEWNRYCIGKFYESKKQLLIDNYPIQNQFTPQELKRPANMLTSEMCEKELADLRGIKHGTISKYGTFAGAIDTIYSKSKDIAYELLSEKFRLSHDNTILLSRLTAPEVIVVRDRIMSDGDLSILHSGTLRNHHVAKIKAETDSKYKKAPEIKQMPKYDPNAEISSLTLTIPSWISSIERTCSSADFEHATPEALDKLDLKLQILQEAINILIAATKGESI